MAPRLEICVDSFESAEAAIRGGAHRLELCSALSEGGLTPSIGLLETIKKYHPKTPIFGMLRPTNRIAYDVSSAEMEIILNDMDLMRANGIDGFVFGALESDRSIDLDSCNAVIRQAHNLPVTFHRAFDMTNATDKLANLDLIERCGFRRVLSSGLAATAEIGINTLVEMKKFVDERMIIMPGCGITVENVEYILQQTHWQEFHASARVKRVADVNANADSQYQQNCLLNNPFFVTCEETVRRLIRSSERNT